MKYVAEGGPVARGWWDADGEQYLARTVHEPEPTKTDTGLLNADGVKLYRVSGPRPVGYVIWR